MGWRQRFDLRQLEVDRLRERARRLRNIRALGQQVAAVRRVGLRGEVLVPVIAILILVVSLGLSRFRSTIVDDAPPAIGVSDPSATAVGDGQPSPDSGYPYPDLVDPTATAVLTDTVPLTGTDVAAVFPTTDAYPGPDGPEPIGSPPGSTFPPPDNGAEPFPTFPAPTFALPSSAYPPPVFTPPTPTRRVPSRVPTVQPEPTVASGGYPAPGATSVVPDATSSVPDSTAVPPAQATPLPDQPTPTVAGTPTPSPIPPTATARPADILTGVVRWTAAQSPIAIRENTTIAPGGSLVIEPGVEVRFASGTQLVVGGSLSARDARIVAADGAWDGIVGTAGSTITLDGVALQQGDNTQPVITASGGALTVRDSSIRDSGGVLAVASDVTIERTSFTDSVLISPALTVVTPADGTIAIRGNRFSNRGAAGVPQIVVSADKRPAALLIENNAIVGSAGPGMTINANTALAATIRCNSFTGGTIGLMLNSNQPSTRGFALAIDTNAFGGQSRYGASGDLAFGVINNWWGDATGPQDAERNPAGRGVPVGVKLEFQPWLQARPDCAPQ